MILTVPRHKLHFNDPRAFDEIYAAGSKFTKEPYFYGAFNEPESSFGYLDAKQAKQRKDIVRPLFSRRAILKLEGVIQTTVRLCVSPFPSADLYIARTGRQTSVCTAHAHGEPAG